MAEVDPYDDSIIRYAIKRHAFDPETNHFRWIYETAFDNKKEYEKKLQEAFDELGARREKDQAHLIEQVTGQVLELGYFGNSKSRRQERKEEGRFYIASPRNRTIFFLMSFGKFFKNSRKLHRFLRRFLSS